MTVQLKFKTVAQNYSLIGFLKTRAYSDFSMFILAISRYPVDLEYYTLYVFYNATIMLQFEKVENGQ